MPTFNRPEDLKRHLKRAMDSFAAEVINPVTYRGDNPVPFACVARPQ
jgi:hypothetical protein